MIASTHDLPLRGNYFAECEYLSQDLNSGTMSNRAGARMLAVSDEFLVAMYNSLESQLGPRADVVIADMAREWGRAAGKQFAAEIEKHHRRPLSQLPLALFTADLTEAFRHHGWGLLRFDFDHYAHGLIVVEASHPIIGSIVKPEKRSTDGMLAAFLAGMFSYFAGVELAAVQTEYRSAAQPRSRFVLTVAERIRGIETSTAARKGHAEVVDELCQARAAT